MTSPIPPTSKRARFAPEAYHELPAAAPAPFSWTPSSVPVAISDSIFEFSSLETISCCTLVSRHFRKLQFTPTVQRVLCRFLGVIPAGSVQDNFLKMWDIEGFIRERAWIRDLSRGDDPLEEPFVCSVLDPLRNNTQVEMNSFLFLIRTAREVQQAMSTSELFNASLRRLILKSPPQDCLLPFFLLTYFRRGHARALELFQPSNLAFRLVFNRSDIPTCTLLADRFRRLDRRDPRCLQNLFTDTLYTCLQGRFRMNGKVTPETLKIFHDLGARPQETAMEYFLDQITNRRNALVPYDLTIFNWLRYFDNVITEKAIEKMLAVDPLLFDISIVREWLIKFSRDGKKELPGSFLIAAMGWREDPDHMAPLTPIDPASPRRRAVNERVALLLEFRCNVNIKALLAGFQVHRSCPVIAQENQDILVERFNASKPTPDMVKNFYIALGYLQALKWGTEKPALILVREWLNKNGSPPNVETLLDSLVGCSSITTRFRDTGNILPSDLRGIERILDFHSDPSIIPTRQIALLVYFIQMRTSKLYNTPLSDIHPKVSDVLKKNGFAFDASGEADFEKHLAEFMAMFSRTMQLNLISFALDLLKGRKATKTTEALFNGFRKRSVHARYREWHRAHGFLSYPGMPPAIEPLTPRAERS